MTMVDRPVMVITGTSRGIGKYLADYYLAAGYQVVGCSRSDATIECEYYTHFRLDVASEKDVNKMFAGVWKRFARLDVLINGAGLASTNHLLLCPASTAENIVRTNVLGLFLCCREAAKIMTKARWGRIVTVGSVDTPLKLEGTAVYAASKAAVVSFTEIIARELSSYNITANCVGPSPVKTDLIKGIAEDKFTAMIGRQAIKRYCEFTDISNVIDFFLSKNSDFVTGQVIYLGGV